MTLREQRDDLQYRLDAVRDSLHALEDYLVSSKFSGPDPFDKYVNRDDILRWLSQGVNSHL